MRRSGTSGLMLVVLLAAGLVLGLAGLFRLRFEAGDVYPPYSSLRADPLGSRALFDSLRELGGLEVVRNFGPASRLGEGAGMTLMWIGMEADALEGLDRAELELVEDRVQHGARLVMALTGREGAGTGAGRGGKSGSGGSGGGSGGDEGVSGGAGSRVSLRERWGFGMGVEAGLGVGDAGEAVLAEEAPGAEGLPATMLVRSNRVLEPADEGWRVVYRRGESAVVMERRLGSGWVVLCADAYLFSNEALRKDRQTAWLAWMMGTPSRVVFDERHLGVIESTGIAMLARRYRLEGLLGGLLLLAGLWVWRSMSPLVPVSGGGGEGAVEAVVGLDTAAALRALLWRNLSGPELLGACVQEWRRSFPQESGMLGRMTTVVVREEGLLVRERDVVSAYGELADLANPRRRELSPGVPVRREPWKLND
jgi:hypothetical protein